MEVKVDRQGVTLIEVTVTSAQGVIISVQGEQIQVIGTPQGTQTLFPIDSFVHVYPGD